MSHIGNVFLSPSPELGWATGQMHVQCFDSNLRESSHFSLLATAMGPELNEIEGEGGTNTNTNETRVLK